MTAADRARLRRQRLCARSAAAGRRMRAAEVPLRERHHYDVFVSHLPYPGGGTRWAIPWPIVYCESGTSGLWTALNPGTHASGPYQLLGWGAPYHARMRDWTYADMIENHRIAARVWDGGRGRRNWVC